MLKKRILPVLLISDGRLVKSINFDSLRETGTPVSQAKIYNAHNVDELIFLDIDASTKGSNFESLLDIIENVSEECFMPIAVGGGIRSIDQIKALLRSGADKVIINTAAVEDRNFVREASEIFGRQCIVASIDVRYSATGYQVYTQGGTSLSDVDLRELVLDLEEKGVGEFVFTSIDNEGVMKGYDTKLIKLVRSFGINRPILINGGAGNYEHLLDAFNLGVDGVCCASIFHFGDNTPLRARAYLLNNDIEMKRVK
jgi:cyclase